MKTLFFLWILLATMPGYAQSITHMVAFGDSFTDNGHINNHGFNRDSNGKVWIDYLQDMIGCEDLDNRAWGGARTDSGHYTGLDWSGFTWQVENFSMASDPEATLFAIWIGINDYWDTKGDPTSSVNNIKNGLLQLIGQGAKRFIVFNNFDLTLAPGYGPESEYHDLVPQVQALIAVFNKEVSQMLFNEESGLITTIPHIDIKLIDIYSFMNELVNSNTYDVTDTPWKDTHEYPHPYGYLWYDEWHPMTSCHYQIATMVHEDLDLE